MAEFALHGGAELAASLESFTDRKMIGVMKDATYAGAYMIASAIKENAPVGEAPLPRGETPGELKESIYLRQLPVRNDQVRAAIGISKWGFYWRFVEFGHARGKGRSAAPQHPFVRPAVDGTAEAAAQEIIDYATVQVGNKLE